MPFCQPCVLHIQITYSSGILGPGEGNISVNNFKTENITNVINQHLFWKTASACAATTYPFVESVQ